MADKTLKTKVYWRTKAFLSLGGFLLVWVNLGMPHTVNAPWDVAFPTWVKTGAIVLATVLVAALDSLPGDRLKAALVFWRWKNPLPGTRAFEKANLIQDPRISIDRLRARLGGSFPRAPQEQNSAWYRLYKEVEDAPQVSGSHYEYLLFRDLTWFSVILTVLSILSLLANWHAWRGILPFIGISALFGVVLMRAASERAGRLVRSVLAIASTQEPKSSEK